MLALGLMSGTSLDGIDAALIETDGETVGPRGAAATVPYDSALRRDLRAAALGDEGGWSAVERALTLAHAEAAGRLLERAGVAAAAVGVVGFHGHTLVHRPRERRTVQIGDGALLAARLGIAVVNDFRSADVAAGGQGAPLVPVYHRALAAGLERPLAVLNLGGVGNVTWIGPDDCLLAFDIGPGNALIDDWALRHVGRPVDEDGALAARGRADAGAVARFADHPYFSAPPPKSLDRDDFAAWAAPLVAAMAAADGAATLVAFTARAVALARRHFPAPAARWLVTGGGRHNPVLMAALRAELGPVVAPVEAVGWDGDALEAQAFAYLAARSLRGLPQTFPGTTGVPGPMGGGRLHPLVP